LTEGILTVNDVMLLIPCTLNYIPWRSVFSCIFSNNTTNGNQGAWDANRYA